MNEIIELRIEVEPIKPDSPFTVSSLIKEAIDESISTTEIDRITSQKPRLIFEQYLPSTEEMNLVVSTLQFVITADPLFFSRIKSFLDHLFSNVKIKKAAPAKISAKLSIGDKKIEVKNLSIEDSIKVITKEYEVLFRPPRKG